MLYPISPFLGRHSCTCFTVAGPLCHSTRRISSSPSEGSMLTVILGTIHGDPEPVVRTSSEKSPKGFGMSSRVVAVSSNRLYTAVLSAQEGTCSEIIS